MLGISYFSNLKFKSLSISKTAFSADEIHSLKVNFPFAEPTAFKCVETLFLPGIKAEIFLSQTGFTPV